MYGDEVLIERKCQYSFGKFRSGDFSLKDEERSVCPVEVDDDQIKTLIDYDRFSSTRDIAEKLDVSHTCVQNRLQCHGYRKKLDA